MALTDHDTTAGCDEAADRAVECSIEFVNGMELSTFHEGEEYHVLGYFLDLKNRDLLRYQERMLGHRHDRLDSILSKLRAEGLAISREEVAGRGGVPTRHHVAEVIVRSGYADGIGEAFEKYLSPGAPAYVPAGTVEVRGAIRIIRGAGGVSSLAHPGDWTPERHVREFVGLGLDAIEVVHPSHDTRLEGFYAALADRLGILKTGGSDFHAPGEDGGSSLGSHNIIASWYVKVKELHNRRIAGEI